MRGSPLVLVFMLHGIFPLVHVTKLSATGRIVDPVAPPIATPTTTTTTLAITSPSTECPSTDFSKQYRETVLEMHNRLRSQVASGRAKNGYYASTTGENFRKAAFMYKMIYNCTAEVYAHSIAKRCSEQASPSEMRPGWVENIQVLNASWLTQTDALRALQNALNTWRDELLYYGLPSNVFFTPAIQANYALTRFTKMIWGVNQQVGCATHLCSGFYTTVCLYKDFVHRLSASIYPLGPTCEGCPPNTCDPNVGLCAWQ